MAREMFCVCACGDVESVNGKGMRVIFVPYLLKVLWAPLVQCTVLSLFKWKPKQSWKNVAIILIIF